MFLSLQDEESGPHTHTHFCVFFVEGRKDHLVHLFETFQLTHSDHGSDVVYSDEGCQRFRKSALAFFGQALDLNPKIVCFSQTRDQLQHHDHVVTFPTRRAVSRKDYLVILLCLQFAM